jgi:uncharacterized protein (TIGR02217 family)
VTTPIVFPQLAGQGWSVHKRPTFSTRVASHVSGREVRSSLYADTLYEFEVTFDALASNAQASGAFPALGSTSLQTLLGFFLQCQGQYGTFLYIDPTDNAVLGQSIGAGDGATTTFVLRRTIGIFTEPVSYVTQINAIYVNAVPQAGYALGAPNTVTLANAPATGAAITADFAYAFLCRFTDDQQDFENVMSGLWTLSSLKFRSVKP